VIAADGRLRDRLLVRNGNWAAWSPTGTAIAFVRGGDIWVKDLHSRTQRRVVRNAEPGEKRCCAPTPDSSPDGKKLAFNRGTDVWVVDLASKRAHRLIRGARNARWSPDGHRIAFERDGTLRNYVFVARVDGTAERRVAEGESPAWSPDGRELAFTDGRRIIRLRLPGGEQRVVYDPGAFVACRFLDWAR
jgi:Tol biopolymer transport system component